MKNLLNYKSILSFAVMLCLFGFSAQAQVPNDICAGALPVVNGQTVQGTTIGATFDGVGTCGTSNTAPGVWYFVVGNGGPLTASTCNQANFDTKISIFTGACGALTCVGGQDDAAGCAGFTTNLTVGTSPGQLYYILVHGFSAATGNFSLTVTQGNPPAGNDACAGALPVACNSTVSGTTVGTTVDNVGFCGTSNTAPGVWYQVLGTGAPITASTCGGAAYDSKLSVYTGSCAALQCVAGNDDACGLQSEVTFGTTNGQVYYILVHGFGAATGAFDLTVTCAQPVTNDDACDADPVGFGTTAFSNFGATAQAGEIGPGAGTGPSSCNSQDGWCSFETDVDNSVWFTFTAPASGCVSIVADGFDSQLALYSVGDCNDFATFTEIAANDDSGDDILPGAGIFAAGIIEASCLTPGATYYIQVDGYNGDEEQNAELTLIDCGGAPLEVDAGLCQTRFVGYAPAEGDTNFLQACATGGLAPYTFTWTPGGLFQDDGATCSNLAVQPNATTTYTVTVTDARGCSVTATVDVNVVDVSCGNNGNKVQVCHVPPGNPANAHEICISANAVPAHIDPAIGHSGDHLGPCGNPCLNTNPSVTPPPACVDLTVTVTTDRFANETSWEVINTTTGDVVGSDSYTFSDDEMTFNTTFCVDPRDCYEVNIFDSFGDGICCSFGLGNWSVTFDGTTTASPTGGAFGSSETISVGNCGNKTAPSAAEAAMETNAMVMAYPNPAANDANIKFVSDVSGNVTVELYTITGVKAATVFSGNVEAGVSHVAQVNVSGLANGVYVYRMITPNTVKAGKMEIAK